MNSLSDKLKSMGVHIGVRNLPRSQTRPVHTIDRVVPGRLAQTTYGEAYVVDGHYPADYQHGRSALAITASLQRLFEWSGVEGLDDSNLGQFYFLDTETTGLAGGTGTYAFLVGVGHFGDQGFELAQFFMRDPNEEAALLAALIEHIDPCHAIVTFNGKAFDAPLLNARYTLQGFSSPLPALAHIDLLPLARRLWRDRLPSRALSYLEVSILGAFRTQEEVPGWLIPQIYFDYLHSGDARPMAGVFYHNAMDILSLAALFGHTAQMLSQPKEDLIEENMDRAAIARLYDELGHPEEAVEIYRQALEGGMPEPQFWINVERLALLYKRLGNWSEATGLWRKAAAHGQLSAHIELAKMFEHALRDPVDALHWTEAAIQLVQGPGFPAFERKTALAELNHRLERLKKKSLNTEITED
ncbi:MAG: tetratricopeptide repeat protein [Anaerolineaceae bacterium]|nr:tetratricopeptide repeat protein [Anaerolineaceae bacterium]